MTADETLRSGEPNFANRLRVTLAVLASAGRAFNDAIAEGLQRFAVEQSRQHDASLLALFQQMQPHITEAHRAEARYLTRIRHERLAGLRYVRSEAARVRRELGLSDDGSNK